MDGHFGSPEAKAKFEHLASYLKAKKLAYDDWYKFEDNFENYVNAIEKLYETKIEDGAGYVTCVIPGVNRTFTTTMGYVRYADRIYSHWHDGWTMPYGTDLIKWNYDVYHGADIEGNYNGKGKNSHRLSKVVRSEFTTHYNPAVYSEDEYKKLTTSTFVYMTSAEYQKIYNWYHSSNHRLYNSVPVTVVDENNNVISRSKGTDGAAMIQDPTLTEIFFYGAGIGLEVEKTKGDSDGEYYIIPKATSDKGVGVHGSDNDGGIELKDDYARTHAFDVVGELTGWFTNLPKNTKNLFELCQNYAYEDGAPLVQYVKKTSLFNHDGKWHFVDDGFIDCHEKRIINFTIRGTYRGVWGEHEEWWKGFWLLTNIMTKDEADKGVEDVMYNCINDDFYEPESWNSPKIDNTVNKRDNPTLVFPSCVEVKKK